jgi:hypothetical protein
MIELQFTGHSLIGFDHEIRVTCEVRNDENGERRGPNDVLYEFRGRVKTEPVVGAKPYQPKRFPPGHWKITEIEWQTDGSIYWPVKIRTDAHQLLDYWRLDEDGQYAERTGKQFDGWGYLLHHARIKQQDGSLAFSRTTLGCLNVLGPSDVLWLARMIEIDGTVGLHVPPWEEWRT